MGEREAAHVVVVGGGVSGLAAAYALLTSERAGRGGARYGGGGVGSDGRGGDGFDGRTEAGQGRRGGGVRVTVLEGSPRVGGKLAGGEVGGVRVDLGAESVLARRPEAVELIRAVGLADELTHPVTTSAGLWIGDRIRALPPTVMGVPVDVAAASDVLGPAGAARALEDARQAPPALDGDVSIGRFVAERMGRAVTDRLVDPLLGGVYAGRADDISLAAAVPELFARLHTALSLLAAAEEMRAAGQMAADQRTAAGSEASAGQARPGQVQASGGQVVAPVFAGVRGGVHRLAEALRDEIVRLGGEVRTGCTVRRVSR